VPTLSRNWTGIETHIDKYVGHYVQGQNVHPVRDEGEMEVCRLIEPYAIGKIQRSQENRF
jgi:hypothetical protein